MASNLIFHVVSKRKWKEFNKAGNYYPEGDKYENGIICLGADRLKEFINNNFQGRRRLFILVIDKARLVNRAEYDENKKYFIVKDKINLDAILDKVQITPDKEGFFDVEITED